MLRITLSVLLLFFSAEVLARGCQELNRVDDSPTAVDLRIQPSNPRPGTTARVIAEVVADGAFSVYCQNPDNSVNYNGGDVDLYLNGAIVSTVKITPNNTNSVYLFAYSDPSCGTLVCNFHYFGYNVSFLSFSIDVPFATGAVPVKASFSGDRQLSVGSDSPPLLVRPFNDVVPKAYIVRAF